MRRLESWAQIHKFWEFQVDVSQLCDKPQLFCPSPFEVLARTTTFWTFNHKILHNFFFLRRFEQLHLGIGDLDKFIWQMHFEDFSHLFLVLVGDVDWWQLKEENFSNSFNDNDDDAEDNCNDDDDDDDNDDEEEDDDDDESGCLT